MRFPRILINYNNWQLLNSTVSRHDYGYSMSLSIERIVTVMWKLYLYVCTNFMVCKRQHALQFGTESVSSINNNNNARIYIART